MGSKYASFAFAGSLGSQMFLPMASAIITQRAANSILTTGWLELSSHRHFQTRLPGIIDASPLPIEQKLAISHGETEDQAYRTLFTYLEEKLVKTHLEANIPPGPLAFVIDSHKIASAIETLESLKRRLPHHPLVIVTSLSDHDLQDKYIQTSLVDLQSLHADDIVQTVLLVHQRSPFATKYGGELQLRSLAHFLIGWIVAEKQNLLNRSCAETLKDVTRTSPFTTLSFASEAVVTGTMPKRWSWLPATANKAGSGNVSDVLAQTRSAIDRIFTKPETCAWPGEMEADTSGAVLCTIPFALNDPRFVQSSRENSLYVGTTYPLASTLTIRGNGLPYPHDLTGRFRVQVVRLHPVSPKSVLAPSGEGQKHTTAALSLPASLEPTNGNTKKARQTTK